MTETKTGITKILADFIVDTDVSSIPSWVFEHAKIAFLDWLGVTLAGKDDPLVLKLMDYADVMGGHEQATIIGHGRKKTVSQAALINGAASHALDYDDSMIPFLGHPSVTLFPGILALSEWRSFTGRDLLAAYIIGLKTGTTIAAGAGLEHYLSGYHGTSTMGAFASAAACSHLMGLDARQTTYALGIAGTQAGGLKKVFGTMCKPFHAGRASETGLTAALLAKTGFTSAEDIMEGPGGFFKTMRGSVNEEALETLGKTWIIDQLAQKYHASCHATHSPIEAALSIVMKQRLSVENINSIRVKTSETALSAAFRSEAHTGLEGKFCIPYCIANALLRGNTGLQAFTDEKVNDAVVQNMMAKITTHIDPEIKALDAKVEMETTDGKIFSAYSDIFQEIPELDVKRTKIKAKFTDLCEPELGRSKTEKLLGSVLEFESMGHMNTFFEMM